MRKLRRYRVILTKQEVESLKEFCDDNLERGTVVINQVYTPNNKPMTNVCVSDLPETLTDITDADYYYYVN